VDKSSTARKRIIATKSRKKRCLALFKAKDQYIDRYMSTLAKLLIGNRDKAVAWTNPDRDFIGKREINLYT